MIDAGWWTLGGALAGAIAGSFIATLAIRWPNGESVGGRSKCDACGRQLSVFELVPVLSFIAARGRCRACGARIDWRHFGIEVVAAMVGGIALYAAPDLSGVAGAFFGWQLLTLAALDIEHFWLPDRLTGLLAISGLVAGLGGLQPELQDRLIGGAAGFAALAGIAWTYRRLRGRTGMGAGDPKLLGAIGLWLGWQALPFVVLGGSIVGLVLILVARFRGKAVTAETRVPLGALLAVAAFPVWISMQF